MNFQFEFRAYPGDDFGVVADTAVTSYHSARSESAARSMAGRLAKKVNGPVDVAHCSNTLDWDARYITTASPSEYHTSGYRFERLE